LLSLEHRVQNVCGFVALVKRRQWDRTKPLALVNSCGFDAVVVDAELLVGVSDGEVEGEVVVEAAVGEVELGKRGLGDMELDPVGFDYEPEDEEGQAHEDDCGHDQLEDEAEDAAAAAAEGPTAAAKALVGASLRRDGWAIVGSIQALFLRHGN